MCSVRRYANPSEESRVGSLFMISMNLLYFRVSLDEENNCLNFKWWRNRKQFKKTHKTNSE